jgi:hypothetical protein
MKIVVVMVYSSVGLLLFVWSCVLCLWFLFRPSQATGSDQLILPASSKKIRAAKIPQNRLELGIENFAFLKHLGPQQSHGTKAKSVRQKSREKNHQTRPPNTSSNSH